MIYDCNRKEASHGRRSTCPTCGGELIAKCGEIVRWHWAHRANECDSWAEPESDWHVGWKLRFPENFREVTMGQHRADIKIPGNARKNVIEFQRSSISVKDVAAREAHYGNMAWVLDGQAFKDRFEVFRDRGAWRFYWRLQRKTWLFAEKEIWVDFGPLSSDEITPHKFAADVKYYRGWVRDTFEKNPEMFCIHWMKGSRGSGEWFSRDEFVAMHLPRLLPLQTDDRQSGEAFAQYMENH